jgi:hypothetical protein
MGKKDDEQPKTEKCPPEPAGCGGKGWTILRRPDGSTHKGDCHVCLGSGEIPKRS